MKQTPHPKPLIVKKTESPTMISHNGFVTGTFFEIALTIFPELPSQTSTVFQRIIVGRPNGRATSEATGLGPWSTKGKHGLIELSKRITQLTLDMPFDMGSLKCERGVL
jgi:hypothetical protein